MEINRVSISTKYEYRIQLRNILAAKGFINTGWGFQDPYIKIVRNVKGTESEFLYTSFKEARGMIFYYVDESALAALSLIPKEAFIDFILSLPSNRKPRNV